MKGEYIIICNEEYYEKIREERKRKGLDIRGIRQVDIENSLYLSKYITDKNTGKIYLVERDYKEYSYWGFGWYRVMLLNCNDSHRIIWYENINNTNEIIITAINKNRDIFDLN